MLETIPSLSKAQEDPDRKEQRPCHGGAFSQWKKTDNKQTIKEMYDMVVSELGRITQSGRASVRACNPHKLYKAPCTEGPKLGI